jgi:DNA polymerase-3 subunit beta
MKINVERGAFLKALGHVQSVVERRNTIPILSNVMIEAAKGQVKLTATDLDIEIVEGLPADVLRNGAATAPAHMLYDIVRKLPEGAQVQAELLSSEGGRLVVSAGSVRFELACLPKEDFPQMATGALPHRFRLAADDIKRLIDKTRFAISTEETRFYLMGIYLHATKDTKKRMMRAVATDGHRLARFELDLPDGAGDIPGVIVPRKTVTELRRLLEDTEGAIEVSLSDTSRTHLETDRRHISRLPARHSLEQRQVAFDRVEGVLAQRRPGIDDLRRQDACRKARDCEGQGNAFGRQS